MDQLASYSGTSLVKVLTGVRRSGKSMILRAWKDDLTSEGVPEENIVHLNFESLAHADLTNHLALYRHIMDRAAATSGRIHILLDEVQLVDSWERAVNSFRVDLDCEIVVTGSNASLLSGELATLLTGRYVDMKVYPLSLTEFAEFGDVGAGAGTAALGEYLRRGGMPGLQELADHGADANYLRDVFNSILLKDVVARHHIRDVDLLERLVAFLLTNLGHTISANRVVEFMKSQRRSVAADTVHNHLHALAEAYLFHKVSRYDLKGKRVFETQEKYFVADHGFAHALLGYRPGDLPGVLENVVCLELLRRGYQVHVGKAGAAEVDFVADKPGRRLYLQVTYLLASLEVMEREFAPLRTIRDNHRKIVVSLDAAQGVSEDGIEHRSLAEFLAGQDW
jgi:predicted AAA+ superfamily ATPase